MNKMRKIMTIVAICMATCTLWAQNEVSLVVSGEGKNKEEATFKALRSAIEQAYGTFVSANTTVLNDQLVVDEIVSLSSGNIQKYEYVSENKMPNGNTFVTLSATVSIDKLVSFAESKGMEAELKGSLFAMNIKKMEFDKQAEEKAVENLCKQLETMLPTLFDYELKLGEPRMEKEKVGIPMTINVYPSANFDYFIRFVVRNLSFIALSCGEAENAMQYGDMYNFPISSFLYYAMKKNVPNIRQSISYRGSYANSNEAENASYLIFDKKNDISGFDKWCKDIGIKYDIIEQQKESFFQNQKGFSRIRISFFLRSKESMKMLSKTLFYHFTNSMFSVVIIDDLGKHEVASRYSFKGFNVEYYALEKGYYGVFFNNDSPYMVFASERRDDGPQVSGRIRFLPPYTLDVHFSTIITDLLENDTKALFSGSLQYDKNEISHINNISVKPASSSVSEN